MARFDDKYRKMQRDFKKYLLTESSEDEIKSPDLKTKKEGEEYGQDQSDLKTEQSTEKTIKCKHCNKEIPEDEWTKCEHCDELTPYPFDPNDEEHLNCIHCGTPLEDNMGPGTTPSKIEPSDRISGIDELYTYFAKTGFSKLLTEAEKSLKISGNDWAKVKLLIDTNKPYDYPNLSGDELERKLAEVNKSVGFTVQINTNLNFNKEEWEKLHIDEGGKNSLDELRGMVSDNRRLKDQVNSIIKNLSYYGVKFECGALLCTFTDEQDDYGITMGDILKRLDGIYDSIETSISFPLTFSATISTQKDINPSDPKQSMLTKDKVLTEIGMDIVKKIFSLFEPNYNYPENKKAVSFGMKPSGKMHSKFGKSKSTRRYMDVTSTGRTPKSGYSSVYENRQLKKKA